MENESTQPMWGMSDESRRRWSSTVADRLKMLADLSGEVKGRIQLDLKDTEDITQALGIVVGAASVSWIDDPVDGRVFDTEMAMDIVAQAEHEITRRVHEMLGEIVMAFEAGMDADQVRAALGPKFDNPNDTLAEWLYNRFSQALAPAWSHANQEYWEHQAAAVRRAVIRGGFKNPMPYDPNKAQCWCGSKLAKREPGDAWGYGCKRNITHKWDGAIARKDDDSPANTERFNTLGSPEDV